LIPAQIKLAISTFGSNAPFRKHAASIFIFVQEKHRGEARAGAGWRFSRVSRICTQSHEQRY
jgi:hypothetical protein